jgi:hypothetical protein
MERSLLQLLLVPIASQVNVVHMLTAVKQIMEATLEYEGDMHDSNCQRDRLERGRTAIQMEYIADGILTGDG